MLWSVSDGTICKKYILYVSQLWKSNYNITIGAARIAIYNRVYSRMREVYQEN